MATTIDFSDCEKTASLSVPGEMYSNDDPILTLLSALDAANDTVALASIGLTGTTYTVTTKDARTYTIMITLAAPPKFRLTSSDDWTQAEKLILEDLGTAVSSLILINGMSSFTVTYV